MRSLTLTSLHMAGVPIEMLSKVVAGHASILMRLAYVKFDPRHVSQVLTEARMKAVGDARAEFPDLLGKATYEHAVRMTARLVEYAGVGDGVSFVDADEDALAGEVRRVAVELGILEGGAIVVIATNDGDAGVHALNESLHELHVESTGAFPMRGLLGRFFSVGSPVIFGRNDYRLGLFNGLLGRVVRTFPDDMVVSVHFEEEAEPRLLAADHLVDWDLAYAVTCHKCQGRSAPRVVVPVYPSRVVDPSWLYTAITRGERQVVIVGDPKHFADASEKKFSADLRRVGLQWSGEAV